MILHNSKRRSWHLILVSAVVFGLQVYEPGGASAQVLNQKVDELLQNNCAGLGAVGGSPNFGPELDALCAFPPTGAASSAGGGAASVQGSAASILNRGVLQRLYETEEEEGQTHARSSSMRLNPFGSLLSLGYASSVSSPLYAATTADGGSTATFTSGSQGRWNGLGFFASGLVESLNRDITTFQDGYRSTIFGFTGGADYRFSKKLVAGLAFSYSNTDGNFRSGGNFSTNSYGGLLFASYLPTDRTFMQVTGGYTRNNYLVARALSANVSNDPTRPQNNPAAVNDISGIASSNSNGNVFTLGLLTGYDHPIGRFTIGPRAGVNYSNTQIGDYTENGSTGIELKYNDQWINSLQSVLGVQGSAAFSTSFGVLVPQFNADYIHEFANSQRLITVQFAQDFRTNATKFQFKNDVPVRNYFNLGTGLVMVLPNGWQFFTNFRAMVGNEHFNNYAGTFGLRVAL
ncbi:MAG: autotransporter outer membrane beta-barrel domain-containing protein [Nitrospira sp.]|nr:autotransporter outer membrane beta-barrel domain-containing protein [Nitrospira sp.]